MRLKRGISLLLAGVMTLSVTALPALGAEGQAAEPTRKEMAQAAIETAAQYGGATSIQYALWEGGQITLSGYAGVYSKTENRALTGDILYGVGSVSKTYTAAAVLKLAEAGKLRLDDKVATLLPGFTMADERYHDITVRMLLDHSSGLMGDSTNSAFLFQDTDQQGADQLLERLSTQRLKADPGAYSVYCNDGFTLAELVVEAVSGKQFGDYLRENLLTPSGLGDTWTPQDAFDSTRLAKTYATAEDTRALPTDTLGIVGTGGIYATASDLAAFGGALCSPGLLRQDSLEQMGTNWASQGMWPEDSGDDQLNYGLGWDSVSYYPFGRNGIQALVKGGDTLQYHAGLVVLPDYDMSVAVLSSGGVSTYNQAAGVRILMDALAERGIEVAQPTELPQAEPAQTPEEMREYAGTYGGLQTVLTASFDEAGHLLLTPAALIGGAAQTYTYQSDGSFRDETGTMLFQFVTESNGRTYLYQRAYTPLPGLATLGTATYALERLEPNPVPVDALAAWAARSTKWYFIINEKYTSQLYASSSLITGMGLLPEAPGYVANHRIVDATLAEQYLSLPGTGARNGSDFKAYEENGVEYLEFGNYLSMESTAAPAIWCGQGAYSTIQADGYARWYQVGDLAGRLLRVTLPEDGSFTVYDRNGAAVASSWTWGDTAVVLPENGFIVFAGEPGARFYLAADL